MSGHDYDVLIVGAGVGGAALALALSRGGHGRVLVVDRRSGPGNINRGDSLLPAVTRHLSRWGALPALRAAGAREVRRMDVHHHRAGLLFTAPLPAPEDAAYLVLPHPEIERALVETARATGLVEVRYRCRVVRLLEEGGAVTGAVIAEDGAERPLRARLVVGADGSSSTVRERLQIPLPTVAYDHGFFIVDVDRPPGYEDAMRIELHPDGGVLVVPQGQERVGLGVLVRAPQEELFRAGNMEDKLRAIARRSPLLAGRRAFPGAHLYALARGHAPRYTARGVVLLGDAVHVTNPTAGQGMTMAIEDAAALSRHLRAPLAEGAPLAPALVAYERERRAKNDGQIRWSDWMSRFYAMPGPLGDSLHRLIFGLGATSPGRWIQQHLWGRMATREAP